MADFEVLFRIPFTIYWVARRVNKPRLFMLAVRVFIPSSGEYFFKEIH